MRVAILGAPRCGKTTYATKLAKRNRLKVTSTGKLGPESPVHTDSFIRHGWDELPDHVIRELEDKDNFILEGCQAARVLRRWYAQDPAAPQLETVIIFTKPHVRRTPAQEAMAKGIRTVIDGLLPELHKAKVRVVMNPQE
jgi:cytidylate kinase